MIAVIDQSSFSVTRNNETTPPRVARVSSIIHHSLRHRLHGGGVEHAPDLAPHGARREVVLELSANNPAGAVRPGDLAPRSPVHGALLLRFRLVNIAQLFAKVKLSRVRFVHVLELDQRGVVGLVHAGTEVDRGRGGVSFS